MLALPFVIIPFVWGTLPDEIPTHWNSRGEPDDYSSKAFGLFLIPVINIGLYLLLLVLPKYDPKAGAMANEKAFKAVRFFMPLFMNVVFIITVLAAMGFAFDLSYIIYFSVTLLLLVLGNYMSSIQPNYFFGIRTPWTLEDPDIWRQTHRLASKIWVAGSLVLLVLLSLIKGEVLSIVFGAFVMVMALIPVGYSFFLYTQKRNEPGDIVDG